MGKKRISTLGSQTEDEARAKHARQLEQKKLREHKKTAKAPGLGGGQRVVDTSQESLAEYEEIQKRAASIATEEKPPAPNVAIKRKVGRSKSYQLAKAKIDPDKTYSLSDALALLRQVSLTKFNPTVELHLTLKENPKDALVVDLPHSAGKSKKVAIADDKTLSQIEKGIIDFDILVASPAQMAKVTKFAKVLGPRGLMPNPKSETVAADPQSAVIKLSSTNHLSLTTEKSAPIIHTIAGKLSYPDSDLSENITAVLSAIPSGQIKKIVLKSTMSPAIKLAI